MRKETHANFRGHRASTPWQTLPANVTIASWNILILRGLPGAGENYNRFYYWPSLIIHPTIIDASEDGICRDAEKKAGFANGAN